MSQARRRYSGRVQSTLLSMLHSADLIKTKKSPLKIARGGRAKETQKLFLPKEAHLNLPHLQLHGFYRPAEDCGGDWWWYRIQDETRISIFVGDVCGHGVDAAIIATCVASCFKVLEKMSSELPVVDLVRAAHEVLNELAGDEYFMTSMALEIDAKSGWTTYWNAGAPFLGVISKEKGAKAMPLSGGPLGMNREFEVGENSFRLNPGDRLLISTDGILELPIDEKALLGERRLLKLLNSFSELPADQAMAGAIAEIDRIRGGKPQLDDFTFVLIETN